jgi:hypothetical protein
MTIRGRGINYDTGFFPGGKNSRTVFDPDVVRREMQIIADDLHCTAVRVSGGDPERLSVAARHAADAGLEVWFAPFPCELDPAALGPLFADCAERAEVIRRSGATVVLVTGCELSLFAAGFLPGETVYERLSGLTSRGRGHDATAQLNGFLADVVADARERFGGRITYASGVWEDIDWTPFDIVSVDAYRDRTNALFYRKLLRRNFRHGKPVVATEFGCCTYRGAGRKGGMGWAIVDSEATPPRLNANYVRSEAEQVTYMRKLLMIFDAEGVDSAFWFTFATYESPHRADPRYDLDMGAYGVVKMLDGAHGTAYPDMAWEPKLAFATMAEMYASDRDLERP